MPSPRRKSKEQDRADRRAKKERSKRAKAKAEEEEAQAAAEAEAKAASIANVVSVIAEMEWPNHTLQQRASSSQRGCFWLLPSEARSRC